MSCRWCEWARAGGATGAGAPAVVVWALRRASAGGGGGGRARGPEAVVGGRIRRAAAEAPRAGGAVGGALDHTECLADLAHQLAGGLRPLSRVLREGRVEDDVQQLGQVGPSIGQARRRLVQLGLDGGAAGLAPERGRAGEAGEDDAGQRVHVALGHRRLAPQLLGRAVAGPGEGQRGAVVDDAEVGEVRPVAPARLHEHRARREVRVDQPAGVGGVEGVGHAGEQVVGAGAVQRALGDERGERLRARERDHHVRAARALAAVHHGRQMRVAQGRARPQAAIEGRAHLGLLALAGTAQHQQLDPLGIVAGHLPGRVAALQRPQQLVARDPGRSGPPAGRGLRGCALAHRISPSRRSSGRGRAWGWGWGPAWERAPARGAA